MTHTFTIIAAMDQNRGIGKNNAIPWRLKSDMEWFKYHTTTVSTPSKQNMCIMGRKTWDSIGLPLPGRASIVMTRDPGWTSEGAHAVADMPAAIAASIDWINNNDEAKPNIILFGGGEIYRQGMDYCHKIEMTIVDLMPDGGATPAYFPDVNSVDWHQVIEADMPASDDSPAFRYETLTRLAAPRALDL
jgi:dihydrofolate reductase